LISLIIIYKQLTSGTKAFLKTTEDAELKAIENLPNYLKYYSNPKLFLKFLFLGVLGTPVTYGGKAFIRAGSSWRFVSK
jgi:hypothetical protein